MTDARNKILALEEELARLKAETEEEIARRQAELEATRKRVSDLEQQVQRYQLQLRQKETPGPRYR